MIFTLLNRYKELVRQGKYVPRSARASLLSGYSARAAATSIAEGSEMTVTELGEDVASRLTAAATIMSSSHLESRYRYHLCACVVFLVCKLTVSGSCWVAYHQT